MKNTNGIPEEYIPYLKTILHFTFYISSVNAKKKSLGRFLRRDYLRKVVLDHQKQYLEALTWATEHPDHSYNELLSGIEFSNQDCLKLFQIFIDHIRVVHDEGPDIVVDDPTPWKVIPYGEWKPGSN